MTTTFDLTDEEVQLLKEAIEWTIPFYDRQVREFFDKFSKSDSERVQMLEQSKELVAKYRNLREKLGSIGTGISGNV